VNDLLAVEVEHFAGDDVLRTVIAIEHAASFESVSKGIGDDLFDRCPGGDVFDWSADGHADSAKKVGSLTAQVDELADAEVGIATHHLTRAWLVVETHLGGDATAEQRGCGDAGNEVKRTKGTVHGYGLFSVQTVQNQQGKSKEKSNQQSRKHANEPEIVPEVVEMGDAAFSRREVATRCGQVDNGMTAPYEADGRFRVEVVSASESGRVKDAEKGSGGVDAEAKEAIANIAPKGLEAGKEVGDLMTEETFAGGCMVKLRFPKDQGIRVFGRRGHERRDAIRVMLTIGIHGEDVGKVFTNGLTEPEQDGIAFAGIWRMAQDAEVVGGLLGERVQKTVAAVSAAIDYHPHGRPGCKSLANGLLQLWSRVVTGNEDQMGFGGR
jgi:hypothetical protein